MQNEFTSKEDISWTILGNEEMQTLQNSVNVTMSNQEKQAPRHYFLPHSLFFPQPIFFLFLKKKKKHHQVKLFTKYITESGNASSIQVPYLTLHSYHFYSFG